VDRGKLEKLGGDEIPAAYMIATPTLDLKTSSR